MKCLAILVNYHNSREIVDTAQSLACDPCCDLIHVVDNSESASEADFLRTHLPEDVRLTVCAHNVGFAGGCNLAYTGEDADLVLLLNPDARLLPGTLGIMKAALAENQRLAAVAPAIYWDEDLRFLLPTLLPEEPTYWLCSTLASRWPHGLGLAAARTWLAWQQRMHQTSVPQPVNYLSGAVLLLRHSAIERAGGLFDPRYFMYFEDADLSRRLRRTGYQLALLPSARAIHHWCNHPEKLALMAQSMRLYIEHHFPWLTRIASLWGGTAATPFSPLACPADRSSGIWGIGRLLPAPLVCVADLENALAGRPIIAISPSPLGFPAIFCPNGATTAGLSEADWQRLGAGRYLALVQDSIGTEWLAFDKVGVAG